MDILNDLLTAYPPNPMNIDLSESEISENEEYTRTLKEINSRRKRKKEFTFDDWCMVYSDELWNLWCIVDKFKETGILDKMTFASFCSICYDNSTKL